MKEKHCLPTVTAYLRGVTSLYKANARAKYPAPDFFNGSRSVSLIPSDSKIPMTLTPLQNKISIKYLYNSVITYRGFGNSPMYSIVEPTKPNCRCGHMNR